MYIDTYLYIYKHICVNIYIYVYLYSVCCHLGPRFNRGDCPLFGGRLGPAASVMSALLVCTVLILVWEFVKQIVLGVVVLVVENMWASVMTWTYETPMDQLAVVAHVAEVDGLPVCLHQRKTSRGSNLHWRQIRCLDCHDIIAGWATPFPLPGDGCRVMEVDQD